MPFKGPGFDPATTLSGVRIVTEGLEPLNDPSMDVLDDAGGTPSRAEDWFLPTRSRLEVM